MAQWTQCSFIQATPTWADAACSIAPDTHDGGDEVKRVHDVPGFDEPFDVAARKDALRDMLARAVDPQAYMPPPAEVTVLAEPFVERLESGALRIDWKRLEREAVVRAKLYDYALEYERRVREFEEDEEDIALLLWHH